jgi:hypothetical protein
VFDKLIKRTANVHSNNLFSTWTLTSDCAFRITSRQTSKYAANLWVWNTPRDGYSGNPKNPEYKPKKNEKKKKAEDAVPAGRVTATFRNKGTDIRLVNAKLYFFDGSTDKEWGSLGFGENLSIHTYKTHVWKVMVDGEVLHTFTIDNEQPTEQEFVV